MTLDQCGFEGLTDVDEILKRVQDGVDDPANNVKVRIKNPTDPALGFVSEE